MPRPSVSGMADTGNNALDRDTLHLIVVPEPKVDGGVFKRWGSKFSFRYPVDRMDSEALVVAPNGQAAYVIEKSTGPRLGFSNSRAPLTRCRCALWSSWRPLIHPVSRR